jgi:hypothetical protein
MATITPSLNVAVTVAVELRHKSRKRLVLIHFGLQYTSYIYAAFTAMFITSLIITSLLRGSINAIATLLRVQEHHLHEAS